MLLWSAWRLRSFFFFKGKKGNDLSEDAVEIQCLSALLSRFLQSKWILQRQQQKKLCTCGFLSITFLRSFAFSAIHFRGSYFVSTTCLHYIHHKNNQTAITKKKKVKAIRLCRTERDSRFSFFIFSFSLLYSSHLRVFPRVPQSLTHHLRHCTAFDNDLLTLVHRSFSTPANTLSFFFLFSC